MSHTPGPWKAKGSQVFDAGDNHLANAQGAWYPSPPPGIREQEEANARLIAAAPELLEALEYVRLILSVQSYNKSVNDDLLVRIDVAIAKAKGE